MSCTSRFVHASGANQRTMALRINFNRLFLTDYFLELYANFKYIFLNIKFDFNRKYNY